MWFYSVDDETASKHEDADDNDEEAATKDSDSKAASETKDSGDTERPNSSGEFLDFNLLQLISFF